MRSVYARKGAVERGQEVVGIVESREGRGRPCATRSPASTPTRAEHSHAARIRRAPG